MMKRAPLDPDYAEAIVDDPAKLWRLLIAIQRKVRKNPHDAELRTIYQRLVRDYTRRS